MPLSSGGDRVAPPARPGKVQKVELVELFLPAGLTEGGTRGLETISRGLSRIMSNNMSEMKLQV